MTAHTPSTLPGGSYPLRRVRHLEEHLLWMHRAGRANGTLLYRRRTLVTLAEFLDADPTDATVADLERWQDHRLRTVSMTNMRQSVACARPYFAYIQHRGYRHDNPAQLLAMPRMPRRVPHPMAEDHVQAMLADAPERVVPWLLCAGWLGLRAGEIASMHTSRFFRDVNDLLWVTVTGKGGHQRSVPIDGWLEALLTPYVPADGWCWTYLRGPKAGVTPVTGQIVSQLCNEYLHRVGIPDVLHSLRHRVGTIAYERTGDLRVVQELLGHLSPETTALYTRVAPQRVAAALRSLPGPQRPVAPIADRWAS